MKTSFFKKAARFIVRMIMVIMLIIIIIPVLVYIPAVQNFAKDIAAKEVKKSTGMDIAIDYLRVRFPLRVELDKVSIVEAEAVDTMLSVKKAVVEVKVMPLLHLDIQANGFVADDVKYQLGTPDSLMYLTASVNHAELNDGNLQLKEGKIFANRALVDGADVRLVIKTDTTLTPPDTTKATQWLIKARDVELKNVKYSMQMYPIIDSLGAEVQSARLIDGTLDMARQDIHARYLQVDSVTASYLYPSPAFLKAHPELNLEAPVDTLSPVTGPWTVTADSLALTARQATYAMAGAKPTRGLDMDYLQVSDVDIRVDSFYNRGVEIKVPLRRLQGIERCGLRLDAQGYFAMDSTRMWAEDFTIATNRSRVNITEASMGMGDIMTDTSLPLSLIATARISPADVLLAFPAMNSTLTPLIRRGNMTLVADVRGTPRQLDVRNLNLNAFGLLRLDASGRIMNVLDFNSLAGKVNLDGEITDGSAIARLLPAGTLPKGILIPALSLAGSVDYSPGKISGDIKGRTGGGTIAVDGHWVQRSESYDADLSLNNFPVNAFVPEYEVGRVTATLSAHGHGYNPLSPSTAMDIDLDVTDIEYQHVNIGDVQLQANLSGGNAKGYLNSGYKDADLTLDFDATISRDEYAWDLTGDIRHLDLTALHLTTDTIWGKVTLESNGSYYPLSGNIDAVATVDDLVLGMSDVVYMVPSADVDVVTTDSTISAKANNGDFHLRLATRCGIKPLMADIDRLPALIDTMMVKKSVDVVALQHSLPAMELDMSMGTDNAVAGLLHQYDIDLSDMELNLKNDSLLALSGHIYDIKSGTTSLDSISISAIQHDKTLAYNVDLNNRPGTLDQFAHVKLNGFIADNNLSAYIAQRDIKGDEGYKFGLLASLKDSTVTARIVPTNPLIAYHTWNINENNYISFNLAQKYLRGDLIISDDKSSLRVYTPGEPDSGRPEMLQVQIDNVQLADWIPLAPGQLPLIKGIVNADLNITSEGNMMNGKGTLSLTDFLYENKKVGDFDADLDLATDPKSGLLKANLDLMVDSVKTMTFNGVLNDSTATSPMMLDFTMIHFPLKVAAPFIPGNMASLEGTVNGSMKITGESTKPDFDGFIYFDSAAVKVKMLGTRFVFSRDSIPVHHNVIDFSDYPIYACNDNPLSISGKVDVNDLANVSMDLALKARNTQIVNSTKARGAEVYGKGFLDLDATVVGNMRFLKINAAANLLAPSNVTYVMSATEATSISSASQQDMVHFVQFNDSAAVASADSLHTQVMAMLLDVDLIVSDGTTVNVELPGIAGIGEGKNKVSVKGQGDLNYTQSPVNDGRMTGRFTINSGFVQYSPPVISEKYFTFAEGSYVAFNGPLMNPTLSIKATDQVKANVTRSGENSRLVNFDVTVTVNGSLENMNVAFDLSTIDDITVNNELTSMSAEQRANQAMNLLLYGVYQGAGTKGNANIGGNLLYSFVESTLNSWVANNIKGVDLSFGIDQYDKTYNGSTQTATSYSYKVSKSLFDNRFKIIVGGSYSTDQEGADTDVAEALFNDISAEYMLNKSGTMYIKVFRHSGYESILEGEITQTGVGFVYRKRLSSLLDMFRKTPKTTQPHEDK